MTVDLTRTPFAIGQKLKAERDPPTDLTPELRNILRRLEEQKDNEK